MSYEFKPESQTFELPNPYKVENLSLFVSGGAMLAAGVASVLNVRDRIGHGVDGRLLAVVAIAVSLMLFGIWLFGTAFTQLRFFFRTQPASQPELGSGSRPRPGWRQPDSAVPEGNPAAKCN